MLPAALWPLIHVHSTTALAQSKDRHVCISLMKNNHTSNVTVVGMVSNLGLAIHVVILDKISARYKITVMLGLTIIMAYSCII